MMSRKRKDNIGEDDMEGYDSNFDDDDDIDDDNGVVKGKKVRKVDLTGKNPTPNVNPNPSGCTALPTKEYFQQELTRAESYRNRYFALNAYERHRKLINEYFLYHPGAAAKLGKRDTSKDKTDADIIRDNHRFLWDDDEDPNTWEKQLAKRYHDKLFKEYCICDLSRYKENKVAMRWRTENELVEGKGQFACGARKCENTERLRTWEVNFAYMEESVKKNALVKLRLCPECSTKLNHGHQRKEVTKKSNRSHSSKRHKHKRHSRDKKGRSRDSEAGTSSSSNQDLNADGSQEDTSKPPENIWKEPLAVPELKSREEEFEEYLDDLFV
ncbi:unnamed protein product [Orchesella dallaii]|uniref:Protein FRA10AC1 n=1 Tax=Orchesella dallaii TaxID=48710 RepID=A0ABP1PK27_9HEXA